MDTLELLRQELLYGLKDEKDKFIIEPVGEVNSESVLRGNEWQNKAFAALKSHDTSKDKASLYNKRLWTDLGKARRDWNRAVKAITRKDRGLNAE
jgi:hypothetical protein